MGEWPSDSKAIVVSCHDKGTAWDRRDIWTAPCIFPFHSGGHILSQLGSLKTPAPISYTFFLCLASAPEWLTHSA